MLRLSAAARSRYSAGEVLNLLTTDVQRVRLFWFQLRDYIYCPFMIIAAMFGLSSVIGWNTCYGIAVLIVILPVSKSQFFDQWFTLSYCDLRSIL